MKHNIMYFSSVSDLTSGASHSLVKLVSLVQKAGHNVVVILTEHGPIEDKLKQEKISYHVIKQCSWNVWMKNVADKKDFIYHLKYPLRQFINKLAIQKITRLVRQYHIDVIHMNTLTSFVGAEVAKREHIKLVWHIREFMEEDLGIEFCQPKKAVALVHQANATIAISQAIDIKFAPIFAVDCHEVIYNGVSIEDYFIDKTPFSAGTIRLLSSGRIMPGKGQKDLLLALAMLSEQTRRKIVCDMIGNVESQAYFDELMSIKEKYQLDNVHFHGFQNDTKAFFEKADVLCVCSKKEAFGRITVEGMLSGALVIGTNSGGTKEIIDHHKTGYLYSPENAKELCTILEEVVKHQEKAQKIAKKGQNKAIKMFSDTANAHSVTSVYDCV
ncbi:glycosyltransferase family 4 protein [Streptococcus sciuri]|uniref:Glycosyltransferase family 4 protein n=1 Tax=Streptococcus sciuri TaxID=2973939 RepID=A0ABT2F5J8_9STRE|nr:glycosyltransferase family 4 protein [Streptococcus sciuri]MCS4487687.1 glycosyltransferase family 4 protein [Streptococcus sciuri]